MTEKINTPQKTEKSSPNPEKLELFALLQMVSILGFLVCGGVIGFFFLGNMLDKHFNQNGVFAVGGMFLGLGLAIYAAYQRIAKHLEQFAPDPNRFDKIPKPPTSNENNIS
jgi:F0F1-type ATP synthase assembly protein I